MSDDISVWITLLRDVGFPIMITAYLLLRFEKKIDKLADTIAELKKKLSKKRKINKGDCTVSMQCSDQAIQRYYQILTAYLAVAKQIESCAGEDKEFYQDICFLFADKMKFMQAEMADQGFVLCQGNRTSFCESAEKNNKK